LDLASSIPTPGGGFGCSLTNDVQPWPRPRMLEMKHLHFGVTAAVPVVIWLLP
jgi:hypothetical protein